MKLSSASRLFALVLGATLIPSCGGNGPPATPAPSPTPSSAGANPSVSRDGRVVVFQTSSPGAERQVVIVDRVNATSVVIDGSDVSNASVTPDGRFVVFDAVPAGGGFRQVFLQNQATGEVTLVSAGPDGAAGGGDSRNPSVSDSGSVVAFESNAVDLGARSASSPSVLVRQVATTTIRSASSEATGSDANPAVSGNGRFVAFESRPVGGGGFPTVLLWNSQSDQLTPVSAAPGGAPADGPSGSPSVNLDGRLVAFESRATNLIGRETPPEVFAGESNVFVRDVLTDTIVTASAPALRGTPANGDSRNPSISGDGARVAFKARHDNFSEPSVERRTTRRHGDHGDARRQRAGFLRVTRDA
jgi:Tol biopolymer transport system component